MKKTCKDCAKLKKEIKRLTEIIAILQAKSKVPMIILPKEIKIERESETRIITEELEPAIKGIRYGEG